jgi:ferric-dicitrate binding protein FerR (iron transport regulator)
MEDIWKHISRKVAGGGNSEDDKEVAQWLQQSPENKLAYEQLKTLWDSETVESHEMPKLYTELQKRVKMSREKSRTKHLLVQFLKVAAVMFLLISLSFFAYHYFSTQKLIVEDTVAFNTIVVPKGNRTQIVLPDSTKVWLTNDTKFVFPEKFKAGSREVELIGEAYFEVKHDEEKPFFVKVGKNRIKVLGTTFAVTAYPDDSFVETSLVEGKVIFELGAESEKKVSYEIAPGFTLNYDRNDGRMTRAKIETSFYDYWKKGIYTFKDESLENLANKIYRIYNIQMVFEDDFLKRKTFTGTLSVNDNVFTFMEAIKRTTAEPIEYYYEKNKIYLKLKRL